MTFLSPMIQADTDCVFFFLHCGTTRVLLAQRCMWCKLWVCPGITSNHPEASRKVLCCCMDFLGVCFLG